MTSRLPLRPHDFVPGCRSVLCEATKPGERRYCGTDCLVPLEAFRNSPNRAERGSLLINTQVPLVTRGGRLGKLGPLPAQVPSGI